jgi:hypothetical protein
MVGVSPLLDLLHGGLEVHHGESDETDTVKTMEAAQALQVGPRGLDLRAARGT